LDIVEAELGRRGRAPFAVRVFQPDFEAVDAGDLRQSQPTDPFAHSAELPFPDHGSERIADPVPDRGRGSLAQRDGPGEPEPVVGVPGVFAANDLQAGGSGRLGGGWFCEAG
jgi:hypothetical protein